MNRVCHDSSFNRPADAPHEDAPGVPSIIVLKGNVECDPGHTRITFVIRSGAKSVSVKPIEGLTTRLTSKEQLDEELFFHRRDRDRKRYAIFLLTLPHTYLNILGVGTERYYSLGN